MRATKLKNQHSPCSQVKPIDIIHVRKVSIHLIISKTEDKIKSYTKEHKYYCGIDLHTQSMYICIINQHGNILVH